jgi:Lar family restriction alleviation protein
MKILECPFCGSSDVGYWEEMRNGWILCDNCRATGPSAPDEQEAITLWNASFSVYNGKTAEEWYRLYKDAIAERHQ